MKSRRACPNTAQSFEVTIQGVTHTFKTLEKAFGVAAVESLARGRVCAATVLDGRKHILQTYYVQAA